MSNPSNPRERKTDLTSVKPRAKPTASTIGAAPIGLGIFVVLPLLLFFGGLLHSAFNLKYNKYRFDRATEGITAELVSENPFTLGSTQVGLITTIVVTLPVDVPVEYPTKLVLDVLSGGFRIDATRQLGDSSQSPFIDLYQLRTITTEQGVLLENLPAVRAVRKAGYGRDLYIDGVIPAGKYLLANYLVFRELRLPDESLRLAKATTDALPAPCRRPAMLLPYESVYKPSDGAMLVARLDDKVSQAGPNKRGAYLGFSRKVPLKYKHDHPSWIKKLDALNLTSCESLDAAKKHGEEQAALARQKRD
jgi:hypothetical protein